MRSPKNFVAIALLMALPLTAVADCYIGGHCEAEINIDNPEIGVWKYTLTVEWDGEGTHALSHLDLLLGFGSHNCECDEFLFAFDDPAGQSDGEYDWRCCTVYYEGFFECNGDPSIPGDEGEIIKFEPYEEDCEPGKAGTGVFTFYSDWQPEEVETPNQLLLYKFGQLYCYGELTGELPVLGCEHVAADPSSWGEVKSQY